MKAKKAHVAGVVPTTHSPGCFEFVVLGDRQPELELETVVAGNATKYLKVVSNANEVGHPA